MLTQDVSQELKDILEQLHAEGKEPTVALVKARLSTSVPMPALITTIKSWRAGELESWRAGELESWRAGELESTKTKGLANAKPSL